jgi:DNA polymerase III subunit gamma/tau
MAYDPLHHKYRPQTFAELVGQEAIATTLTNALLTQRIAPAYLFTGPRGTGKTSSARILAKSLNCQSVEQPTPTPCGECEVCRMITRGSALDVIEIDAASNTGVDNIREIIERSQFAPVQCRYKVYVIDECLTGDSLIQTQEGLIRIDNPEIKGKMVLSYNENQGIWEYKKVLRWLDQGIKQTLIIKTNNREIRCTDNHLIRTDQGWIAAKDIREGMKILSPVAAVADNSSINMAQMGGSVNSPEDINLKTINSGKNLIIWPLFSNKQNSSDPCALVDVRKNWIFPNFYSVKDVVSKVLNLTGENILIKNLMEFGKPEPKNFWTIPLSFFQKHWDSFMGLFWEIPLSPIPTHIADFPDWPGITVNSNNNGLNTKLVNYPSYNLSYGCQKISVMDKWLFSVIQSVTHNLEKFSIGLNPMENESLFQWIGYLKSPQKDLLGGIWMMDHLLLAKAEVQAFNYIQKDFQNQNIKSLPNGLINWVIPVRQNLIVGKTLIKSTTTLNLDLRPLENGCLISNNTQFPQWNTNLETVESIKISGLEKVYDIEVEDNHNFIANGLTVHNCHMLSTAAFNALLKTLEEPPPRVVFVLATTDPQRVLPTIISRCQRFDYRRIPLESMAKHLQTIAQKENIDIEYEAINLVAQIANGGLRDAESLLDQLSLSSETVTVDKVWDLVGAVPEQDLITLLQAIRDDKSTTVIDQCRHLMNRGREPLIVLQNLASFYLNLLIAKTAPNRQDMVAVTNPTWEKLCQEAKRWDIPLILLGQQHLKENEYQLKNTTQPRLWLEIALLGLLPSAQKPVTIVNQTVTNNTAPSSPPKTAPQPVTIEPKTPVTNVENQSINPPVKPVAQPTQIEPKPPETITVQQEPESESISNNISQEQFWQKVLNSVHPPTTQSLLKQQCTLINFQDNVAIIGVKSEPLLKMAQGKKANIEAAFETVCQQKITVHLKVASAHGETTKQPSNNYQTAKLSEVKPVISQEKPPVLTIVKDTPRTPPQPVEAKPKTSEYNSHNQVQPKPESQPLEVKELKTEVETLTPGVQTPDTELSKIAENLAKSFNGEIIELDLRFQPELLTQSDNNITPENEPSELNKTSSDDAEDEMPF